MHFYTSSTVSNTSDSKTALLCTYTESIILEIWGGLLSNKIYQDRVSKLNTKADKLEVNSMISLFGTLILFSLLLDISLSFLISHLQGQRKKKSFYLILAASDSQLKEIIKTKSHTTHQRGYF